jgi:hypothetical protein
MQLEAEQQLVGWTHGGSASFHDLNFCLKQVQPVYAKHICAVCTHHRMPMNAKTDSSVTIRTFS